MKVGCLTFSLEIPMVSIFMEDNVKISLLIIVLTFSFTAIASRTAIVDIWSPEASNEPYLVLTSDGRVYEVSAENQTLISKLRDAKQSRLLVRLKTPRIKSTNDLLQMRSTIYDVVFYNKITSAVENKNLALEDVPNPMDGYTPSTLNSMATARTYFNSMKAGLSKRSQCYNRAHVWTYELDNQYGAKTKKVWLFFTRRYIREYRYHWWFHVTPVIQVAGESEDISLDRRFLRGPLALTPWKNIFMRNNAFCPTVTRYSSYRDYQYDNYCYFIKTSMYFWQPYQIENLERGRGVRTGWIQGELNTAYANTRVRGWRWWRW